ncbi:hypothetical protein MASR1M12_07910 [Erysipelotrichia bacterium]
MYLLTTVAEFAASTAGAVVVSFTIIFFAVYQYFWRFKALLLPLEKQIDQAIDLVGQYNGPTAFYENFEDFKEEILNIPGFSKRWQKFRSYLIIPKRGEPGVISSAANPCNFFTLSDLGVSQTVANRINSIPGTLTGLGIFGTFVGLTSGIFLAQNGLIAGDTQEVTRSLGKLLNGASLAFLTSIAGLGTSLFYSWRKFRCLKVIDAKLSDFNNALSGLIVYKPSEIVYFEALQESRAQTIQLKDFSDKLATDIAVVLEQKVTGNISPLLEKLITGIENLSKKQSEVGSAAIEQASKTMNDSIASQMGSQLQLLAGTFDNLHATLERSSAMLVDGQEQIQSQSQKTAESVREALLESSQILKEKFKSSLKDFTEGLEEVSKESLAHIFQAAREMDESLVKSFRQAEVVAEKINGSCQLLLQFTDSQNRVNVELDRVITDLGYTGDVLAKAGEPIKEATINLSSSMDSFKDLATEMINSSRNISVYSNSIKESNKILAELWDNNIKRFAGMDDTLADVIKEILSGIESYTENIQAFHKQLDESVAKVVSKLSGAVGEFGGQLEELSEIMENSKK